MTLSSFDAFFLHRPRRSRWLAPLLALLIAVLALPATAAPSPAQAAKAETLLKLGAGDAVRIQVFGRSELDTTTYVSDDGTVPMPLAGPVKVEGLSPAEAGKRIAKALRDGQYLNNPQVTVFLVQFRSQQVSVLGEVRAPGRFPVESKATVFDLVAQAGGITEAGADVVYLLRPAKNGANERHTVDLRAMTQGNTSGSASPSLTVQGGDSIFVPRAGQFYIYGEVQSPNMYRLEPGMTVMQAISRGGGITPRGSHSRMEIRRKLEDGRDVTLKPKPTDLVQPDDVIRVKERIF